MSEHQEISHEDRSHFARKCLSIGAIGVAGMVLGQEAHILPLVVAGFIDAELFGTLGLANMLRTTQNPDQD